MPIHKKYKLSLSYIERRGRSLLNILTILSNWNKDHKNEQNFSFSEGEGKNEKKGGKGRKMEKRKSLKLVKKLLPKSYTI